MLCRRSSAATAATAKTRKPASATAMSAPGLNASDMELLSVCVMALAKTCLHYTVWSASPRQALPEQALRRSLSVLLLLAVHPVAQAVPEVQQGLSVFWEAWATAGRGHRALLAQAALPAAREALGRLGSKAEAPHLLKYVLQLLCGTSDRGQEAEDEEDHAGEAWQGVAMQETAGVREGLPAWGVCFW
jgi:hypothetical protein